MEILVTKFGGSSLANAAQFKKVHNIILSNEKRRYVIPSAPGKQNNGDTKVTDLLYLCHQQIEHGLKFDDTLDMIVNRYEEIIRGLNLNLDLQPYVDNIKKHMMDHASLEYIVSRGEYLNGILLASLLNYEFIDAKNVVCFNKDGLLDLELTNKKMKEYLSKYPRAVIPGFYGSLPNGEIQVFSRGGSDITGALVARAVNASIYENWTDVSGLLITDPSIVKNAKPIETITYRELRELSYAGATVLHEETIFPVLDAGIPINIKNTNKPDNPGTMIVSYAKPIGPAGGITGIAGRKDFTVISIEKNRMKSEIGFVRKLLTILESYNIYPEHMPSGIDTISLIVMDCQLNNKLEKLIKDIEQQCNPDLIEVFPNMAVIATVGHGMAYTPGISAKLFTALADKDINVRMIDQGSSEINIIVGVETDDFEEAVAAIYHAFVK